MNKSFKLIIEDWDGDRAIRIPDEDLQQLGLDVGDSLYLLDDVVGNNQCLVLSKVGRGIGPQRFKPRLKQMAPWGDVVNGSEPSSQRVFEPLTLEQSSPRIISVDASAAIPASA